ncbi:MAG: HAMP domain-containing sensor histidine kinase [Candidatus Moraniibacteriota bacterium]
MNNLVKKIRILLKERSIIFYSSFLIVCIAGIILFNTFYSLQRFQQSKDVMLQKKATLVEDIFQQLVVIHLANPAELQRVIEKIGQDDDEIMEISVMVPAENHEAFLVVANTGVANVGQLQKSEEYIYNTMAWQAKKTGVAFLDSVDGVRFWTVVKPVLDEKENKLALVSLKLSLAEADAFTDDAIRRVYWVTFFSMLLVLLLISNHARLFLFVAKAAHLEEIDKMKDDFISMASHELKSPLTAIRGYLDLMSGNFPVSDKERVHYIKNMNLSVIRLNDLVEDLLDVSRIEQNRIPMVLEKIQLQPIITQLVDEMSISAKNKNLIFSYTQTEIPFVKVDPDRVKQIIVNLLSNAVKYTKKGAVETTTKFDEKFVYLIFADTGIGMSAGQLKNLFGKFYRVSSNETKDVSGSGLGLWISLQLTQKMGGDISVESIEGVGSHFTLKLPRYKE